MSVTVVYNKKYDEYVAGDVKEISNIYNLGNNVANYDSITCMYISKLSKNFDIFDSGMEILPKSLELLSIKDTCVLNFETTKIV